MPTIARSGPHGKNLKLGSQPRNPYEHQALQLPEPSQLPPRGYISRNQKSRDKMRSQPRNPVVGIQLLNHWAKRLNQTYSSVVQGFVAFDLFSFLQSRHYWLMWYAFNMSLSSWFLQISSWMQPLISSDPFPSKAYTLHGLISNPKCLHLSFFMVALILNEYT